VSSFSSTVTLIFAPFFSVLSCHLICGLNFGGSHLLQIFVCFVAWTVKASELTIEFISFKFISQVYKASLVQFHSLCCLAANLEMKYLFGIDAKIASMEKELSNANELLELSRQHERQLTCHDDAEIVSSAAAHVSRLIKSGMTLTQVSLPLFCLTAFHLVALC